MHDERFWELIDLLGGVAGDTTVPRLEAGLQAGEAEPFLDRVYELVAALLARCDVPASHVGETAEWIAAAVVAAGRSTYERTLASGTRLDPESWMWGEAEALLVAGVDDVDDEDGSDHDDLTDRLEAELGVTFQWRAVDHPPEVITLHDPATDDGDDPSLGQVLADDEEWTATLAALDGDPEFHRRRSALAAVGLHVVVRDVEEATLMAWPSDDDVQDVVITVPVEVVLAAQTRHDAYLEAVVTLVTSVGEALGTAP